MSTIQNKSIGRQLHDDERGAISIVSLFALLLLTMLLGMVTNVGRQVDSKIKLQNAADAVTYSGGVVLARGMNTLAYTNHLICDVFALTAFLREGRDHHGDALASQMLDAWSGLAPIFQRATFSKFKKLGDAIPTKVTHERQLVQAYSTWMHAVSEIYLQDMEQILARNMIRDFQRAFVEATPRIAQLAAAEVARQHGETGSRTAHLRGQMLGVLWRTAVDPVGGNFEGEKSTLPAVDPLNPPHDGVDYLTPAIAWRHSQALHHLRMWNNDLVKDISQLGKMSQFGGTWVSGLAGGSIAGGLWAGFTCGQLEQLLSEYPDSNLPFMIREPRPLPNTSDIAVRDYLEGDFVFLGVTYWPQLAESMPGIFQNPLKRDVQAYAQGMLFIPRRRLVMHDHQPDDEDHGYHWYSIDGLPYQYAPDHVHRRSQSMAWDLSNQDWTFQLMPATAPSLLSILKATPTGLGTQALSDRELNISPYTGVTKEHVRAVNTH